MLLRETNMTEISMEDFEDVALEWLQSKRKTLAPKSTGRRLTSLKAFVKWAKWPSDMLDEYSAPTPAKGIPHPLPEGFDGVTRMVNAANNERQQALITLCGMLGCRVAEALAVKASDFDLNNMTLSIRGKGDKTRIVPISPRAWEILSLPVTRAYVAGDGEVVGLRDRFARRVITDLGIRAGLQRRVSSHDLRATFGSAVYNKTLDLRVTQELLGHASSATTELYTGISMDKMRGAVEL
jgi:site-specific recombinase XerD